MDPLKCQTPTASPAEPGELPIFLAIHLMMLVLEEVMLAPDGPAQIGVALGLLPGPEVLKRLIRRVSPRRRADDIANPFMARPRWDARSAPSETQVSKDPSHDHGRFGSGD